MQAERLKAGVMDGLQVARFRGAYRLAAQDLNQGMERSIEKAGGVTRKPADLESILGPVPAQPAMSAFSFPMADGGSSPMMQPPHGPALGAVDAPRRPAASELPTRRPWPRGRRPRWGRPRSGQVPAPSPVLPAPPAQRPPPPAARPAPPPPAPAARARRRHRSPPPAAGRPPPPPAARPPAPPARLHPLLPEPPSDEDDDATMVGAVPRRGAGAAPPASTAS